MSRAAQEIKKLLIGLAEYYRTNLTPGQLSMYAEDLEDLPIADIGIAIKRIRQNAAQQFFPLPAIIRQEIIGNERDEALEASNRILEAMAKYGYTNPERARQFIGELGWRVVEREGGWQSLCERTQNDDVPTLKAQWRELARATQARVRTGQDDHAPGLTRIGGNAPKVTHVSEVLKAIPFKQEGKS